MMGSRVTKAFVFFFVSVISFLGLLGSPVAYEKEIEALCTSLGNQINSSGKKTIAVVDFTDLQGTVTELGRFIAEEVSINLAMGAKGYQVIDRGHLKSLLQEHKLTTTDIIDPKTARQLGRISGVEGLITGIITPFGDSVRLSIKVLDVETAKVFGASTGNIAKTKVIEELLAKELGRTDEGKGSKSESTASGRGSARAVEMDGFVFRPVKCVRKGSMGSMVACTISFVNEGDNDRSLAIIGRGFPGQRSSCLVDNNGNEYKASPGIGIWNGIPIGATPVLLYFTFYYQFPPKLPINIDFTAERVSSQATSMTASIGIDQFKQLVVIKDIPIAK